mmetsp:Transcript_12566/g.28102  ORF Transcript_12566/g.28102 Transcript_12566/m.28102 type:complete len:445 (-) Transcript_12566:12-1346(-)
MPQRRHEMTLTPVESKAPQNSCLDRGRAISSKESSNRQPPGRRASAQSILPAKSAARMAGINFCRMQKLLELLPRDRRRHAIQHLLSEEQRLLLEQWMLSKQQLLKSKAGKPSMPQAAPQQKRRHATCSEELNMRTAQSPRGHRRWDSCCESCITAGSRRAPRPAGIHKHTGSFKPQGISVSASTSIGMIRLRSKAGKDVSLAHGYLLVLCTIKRFVEESTKPAFEDRFKDGVSRALQACHVEDASELGLRFHLDVHVTWFRMSLKTRAFKIPSELDAGLLAWRRIEDARMELPKRGNLIWAMPPTEILTASDRLCTAYLAVMAEGCADLARVVAHVEKLRKEQFQKHEKMLEVWNQTMMSKEDSASRLQAAAIEAPGFNISKVEQVEEDLRRMVVAWAKRLLTLAARTSRQRLKGAKKLEQYRHECCGRQQVGRRLMAPSRLL